MSETVTEISKESLERDNARLSAALRKIARINPALVQGGPNSKYFGRGHERAFNEAQNTALGALNRLENHVEQEED